LYQDGCPANKEFNLLGEPTMPAQVESMAYFGAVPWHGLGTPLEEADLYDWQKACQKAGLAWDVELVPLVTGDNHAKVDRNAVRRTSDGRILGTVGPRYTLLQNRDAFKWFQPFLEAKEAALNTAGSLCEGSRVWVLAKLQRDPIVVAQGDEIEKFLLLSHGHDGSLSVRCGFTPVRCLCSNTLAMAHGSTASKLIRVKHTKDMHQNLENIREVMNLANEQFEATGEQYRLLARKSINQADLKKYVERVLKVEAGQEVSTRLTNTVQKIIGLCESGRGNNPPSVSGTYWTALNGIGEWLSYERGQNQDNRLNSLWFGDSANLNQHALETALAMAA
jgi:phage/plasmid-like protein (TIGR03299 family)